eukprot:15244406-Ditylum_brightwellii.AAC.1
MEAKFKQEVQRSKETRQHVVEAREHAVANTKLIKQDTKSMRAELSVQKKLFAEREVSLCLAHKEELDVQKTSFVEREASLSKSYDEKMQAKMEDMKTLGELLQDKKKKEVQVTRSCHKDEQKQQVAHTAIQQAKKTVEAKQHISAHNLDIERRKQKKANERERRDYVRIIKNQKAKLLSLSTMVSDSEIACQNHDSTRLSKSKDVAEKRENIIGCKTDKISELRDALEQECDE